jgi:hypothetical protein
MHYVNGINFDVICSIMGISSSSMRRWQTLFNRTGNVEPQLTRKRLAHILSLTYRERRWPESVYTFIGSYIELHPCFYLEELQLELQSTFLENRNFSTSTICRALKLDMKITRKVLAKRAREASSSEVEDYIGRLSPFYTNQDQLVFVDETSKDGRSSVRKYGWSRVGAPCVAKLPFTRGKRISALCAMDSKGFFAMASTEETFDRHAFHLAMITHIIPKMNPYPLPRSILILDNAKIHMYQSLQDAVHEMGGLLFFLPPYSPQLNPIEVGFANMKAFIIKHANLAFPFYPARIMQITLDNLFTSRKGARGLFRKSGYGEGKLLLDIFREKAKGEVCE